MAKIKFDLDGERFYEAGVSNVVLFLAAKAGETPAGPTGMSDYIAGVGWNGITAINESTEGGEINKVYADNMKYLSLVGKEDFKFSIECYQFPDEWYECDGCKTLETDGGIQFTNQARRRFGLAYRTEVGEDTLGWGDDAGLYKLHLVYGCLAKPSSRNNTTINENIEAMTMSYEVETTPIKLDDFDDDAKLRETAHIIISSKWSKIAKLEEAIYGTDGTSGTDPYLPNAKGLAAIKASSFAAPKPVKDVIPPVKG